MSVTPFCRSFFGIGSCPHSGMPGPPSGPAFLSTSTLSASTSRSGSSMRADKVVVVFEDDGLALVAMQPRIRGRRLDHRAVGTKVAAQDREAAVLVERLVARQDHVIVEHPRAGDVLAQRLAVHRDRVTCSLSRMHSSNARRPARVVEILHQVLACGTQVRDERRGARELVEPVEVERAPGTARHGDEMHQRVRRPSQREHCRHRVVERVVVEDLRRRAGLPTPSRRCACPCARPSARGANRVRGSTRRRAA